MNVLVVRQDNNGDVLLTGPAIRAIAASGARITMLCAPRGMQAARMLPDVDHIIALHSPWIDAEPETVSQASILEMTETIRATGCTEALIFTSFHQSPLPTALLLRMANINRIGAVSIDYPGSLLNVRHSVDDAIHEVERNLSLAQAMGYTLPLDDDRRLHLRPTVPYFSPFDEYIVVHPGATVPARTLQAEHFRSAVELITQKGYRVVVTGDSSEIALTANVAAAGSDVLDLGGQTTFEEYCSIVRHARAIICGNTAAAHVASATGTPIVSIFPPTIPAQRFRPWHVPHILLGHQDIACAGCRAKHCPIAGQPCLASVTPQVLVQALEQLLQQTNTSAHVGPNDLVITV